MAATRGPARVLTVVAMVLATAFGLIAVMFTVGEAVADPGGWAAAGLVALWLVPLAALLALTLLRPVTAAPLLVGLTVLWAAVVLWAALAAPAWRSFENGHGPVRAVAALVLGLPLAALGWHRQRLAGVLLVVLAGAPVVLSLASRAASSPALTVVVTPLLATGALLLVAGSLPHRVAQPADVQTPARTRGRHLSR